MNVDWKPEIRSASGATTPFTIGHFVDESSEPDAYNFGHKVELRLLVLEKNVTLEVCDDGPDFFQAFSPRTAAHFGLDLVESIGRVDLGGVTTYENRSEGGACVRVTFPIPVMPGKSRIMVLQ